MERERPHCVLTHIGSLGFVNAILGRTKTRFSIVKTSPSLDGSESRIFHGLEDLPINMDPKDSGFGSIYLILCAHDLLKYFDFP